MLRLNESNVIKERYTDPNNVSHVKSDCSITISHHTFNHSNYDSEKVGVSNLKHNGSNGNLMLSSIDAERRVNNENRPMNICRPNEKTSLTNFGSPISIFNPERKVFTPQMLNSDKANNDNVSLEDLISKIDSRREIFKKSVREEMEENIGNKFKTPEFTDSPLTFFDQTVSSIET